MALNSKKKILVFIDEMGGGGAARVTSTLINGLSREYNVVLVTNKSKPISYPLLDGLKVLPLYFRKNKHFFSSLQMHINYIQAVRRYINDEKPHLIIAVQSVMYFWVKIASLGMDIPIVASDHTTFNRNMGLLPNFIRNHFYAYADCLTILTNKDARLLGHKFPRKQVVYNPLSFPILEKNNINREKTVLCAGRINQWHIKGFDIIIDIWFQLSQKYPDWKLKIAGTGSKESLDTLHFMIKERGLEKSVTLLGQVSDMASLLQGVSIFALPSRIEGMPMVLIEAMSQGCACISFDIQGAVYEMISDNYSGIIVPDTDVDSFCVNLEKLISDDDLRLFLGTNALIDAEKFSVETFMNKWYNIINKLSV